MLGNAKLLSYYPWVALVWFSFRVSSEIQYRLVKELSLNQLSSVMSSAFCKRLFIPKLAVLKLNLNEDTPVAEVKKKAQEGTVPTVQAA